MPRAQPVRLPREAVNLSADPALLAEARELEVPLSATFDAALRERVLDARRARWRKENAEAIAEYNARVAREGVFSDGLRRF
jgi:antitoxin CcdA